MTSDDMDADCLGKTGRFIQSRVLVAPVGAKIGEHENGTRTPTKAVFFRSIEKAQSCSTDSS
jgi:hypothetical protein